MIRQKQSLWTNKNVFINLTRKTLVLTYLKCSQSQSIFHKISYLISLVGETFNIMIFTIYKSHKKITKDLELKEAILTQEWMLR